MIIGSRGFLTQNFEENNILAIFTKALYQFGKALLFPKLKRT